MISTTSKPSKLRNVVIRTAIREDVLNVVVTIPRVSEIDRTLLTSVYMALLPILTMKSSQIERKLACLMSFGYQTTRK